MLIAEKESSRSSSWQLQVDIEVLRCLDEVFLTNHDVGKLQKCSVKEG